MNPIVIAGAGPGGLILGYLLALNKIEVRVFERHKDFDRQFRGEFLQPSAMPILEELGLLKELNDVGAVIPVSAVKMHFKKKVVSTTLSHDGQAAGFLVHQPTLLQLLHSRCSALENFTIDMQSVVTGFSRDDTGRVDGIKVRKLGIDAIIKSRLTLVCNGRLSSLRSPLDLIAKTIEPTYTILWQRFDMSKFIDLMPTTLEGYVGPRGLCVVFPTHGKRLQVMWRRRPEYMIDLGASRADLNNALLEDLPPYWSNVVSNVIENQVEQQPLKVVSDRLLHWWSPGTIFIGDAAHSMSPIGGQGLAMAIRDAVVTANHIIRAHQNGETLSDEMCEAIQREREPEIVAVQKFQKQAAHLHVASPLTQWGIANIILPLVTVIKGKSYMENLQNGFSKVQFDYLKSCNNQRAEN